MSDGVFTIVIAVSTFISGCILGGVLASTSVANDCLRMNITRVAGQVIECRIK